MCHIFCGEQICTAASQSSSCTLKTRVVRGSKIKLDGGMLLIWNLYEQSSIIFLPQMYKLLIILAWHSQTNSLFKSEN